MVHKINRQMFSFSELEIAYKILIKTSHDTDAAWKSFQSRTETNLKSLLHSDDASVKFIFANILHRVEKATYIKLIDSVFLSNACVVHGMLKLNNFQCPSHVFAQDGHYGAYCFDKTGIMNMTNHWGLCLDKTLLR